MFFFDEAHLLFDDASEAFLDQVAQTVRLIRSKGVGVFFVTQLPDDVPDEVLAQLGNRVQHALRAFTPRDAKALKAAVTTYPKTDDYDLEEDLTQLGTGEAMVTILSERGAPTPVVWTRLRPPPSLMAAIDPAEVDRLAKERPRWATYAEEVDRESARERLAARLAAASAPAPDAPADRTPTPRRPAPQGTRAEGRAAPVGAPPGSPEGRQQRGDRLPAQPRGPLDGQLRRTGRVRPPQEEALRGAPLAAHPGPERPARERARAEH